MAAQLNKLIRLEAISVEIFSWFRGERGRGEVGNAGPESVADVFCGLFAG